MYVTVTVKSMVILQINYVSDHHIIYYDMVIKKDLIGVSSHSHTHPSATDGDFEDDRVPKDHIRTSCTGKETP